MVVVKKPTVLLPDVLAVFRPFTMKLWFLIVVEVVPALERMGRGDGTERELVSTCCCHASVMLVASGGVFRMECGSAVRKQYRDKTTTGESGLRTGSRIEKEVQRSGVVWCGVVWCGVLGRAGEFGLGGEMNRVGMLGGIEGGARRYALELDSDVADRTYA